MKITPTPTTAALAGLFSGIAWPWLWSRFGSAAGSVELIVGTLLVIALPAHALVVGFGRSQASQGQTLDRSLLTRVGVWLFAAAATAIVGAALRA